MPKYIKCPRCELNWIPQEEEYCDVCKAELHMGGISLLEDEEEEERLCPICHRNYLEDGEKYCSDCREKKLVKAAAESYDTTAPSDTADDTIEVSFDEIEREENWGNDDDESFDDSDDFAGEDFADDLGLEEDEEESADEESDPVEDELEKDFDFDADDVLLDDEDDDEDLTDEDEDL